MSTIAVIPARGGSKRIPHKNIMDFMGKPLMAWTIIAAKESEVFDRIVVSTDDSKIANVAMNYGVEVPFYRKEANDDITPVSVATISAVKQATEYWNEEYNTVVQLMPNCPLRNKKDIAESLSHFVKKNAKFQLSCFKFGWMNPWWAMKLTSDFKPEFIFPDALKMRSQDLPDLYCPTGAVWIAKQQELFRDNSFYGKDHIFFPIDWKNAMDIDNYDDVDFARSVFNIISGKNDLSRF